MKKVFYFITNVLVIMVLLLGTMAALPPNPVHAMSLPPNPVNAMSGSGAPEDPYIIRNVYDLQNMQNDLDAYYELGNDIDASATETWNNGAGFEPIGNENPFQGALDGKGYKIYNLYINRPSQDYVGLFSYGWAHWLRNVHLVDCNITGRGYIGALIGEVDFWPNGEPDTIVDNCSSTGHIYGGDGGDVGGLIGFEGAQISNCHSSATIVVTATSRWVELVGGLIGTAEGHVEQSYATGSVTVNGYPQILAHRSTEVLGIGGFVGFANYQSIERCYATGNVTVNGDDVDRVIGVGGFIGFDWAMYGITNCYARGNVTVNATAIYEKKDVGGFSGCATEELNCYSTGHVTITAPGYNHVGGFTGEILTSGGEYGEYVTNCFWDTQTSGMSNSAGGTGKTTAEMKTKSTFTDAGWDFTTIWDIDGVQNDGYPFLFPREGPWSFAVITDLHIGRGYADYGLDGYEDENISGFDYYLTERLKAAVNWINSNKNNSNYTIDFVVVMGDIADSAERSELCKARTILDKLNDPNGDGNTADGIPYIPIFGNHDIWPYTDFEEADPDEPDNPELGEYFEEVFWIQNAKNRALLESITNYTFTKQVSTQYFQNYYFRYNGTSFIGLDFIERRPGNPGVLPGAEPQAQTLSWLTNQLNEYQGTEPLFLLSHIPFEQDFVSAFSNAELDQIEEILEEYEAANTEGQQILGCFAGHIHGIEDLFGAERFVNANREYPPIAGAPVVTTEAIMVGSNLPDNELSTINKGIIRIVKVAGPGNIDYSTIEGRYNPDTGAGTAFIALNPNIGFKNGETVNNLIQFTFYPSCFTTREINYQINFGDGSNSPWLSGGTPFNHQYARADLYQITLTVKDNATGVQETFTEAIKVEAGKFLWNIEIIDPKIQPISTTTKENVVITGQSSKQAVLFKVAHSSAKPVALATIHFEQATGDIDMTTLVADYDAAAQKSVFYMPSWPTEVEESKVLLIPYSQDSTVYICPQATSLTEVNPHAPGTVFLEPGETTDGMTAIPVIYDGEPYYLIGGFVNGGGGVLLPNQPPVLAPIGNKTIGEGQLLSFTISATDSDGDPLTYSASNLPLGATFDPATRTFSWTPGYEQAGTYANVHFEVSDGKLTDSEDISIRVNNCVDLFMHGAAPDLILDMTPPSSTSAKYKDSPGVKRTTFMEIGTWNAAPMTETQNLTSLGNLTVWVGLKNSDDQGTYFDIRAEVLKNGVVIASAEVKDIQGVTRNPDKATKVVVTFGTISDTTFAVGDIFSIRVLTKVADTGGHSNAVGLRLYYDSVSRPSLVNTMFYR